MRPDLLTVSPRELSFEILHLSRHRRAYSDIKPSPVGASARCIIASKELTLRLAAAFPNVNLPLINSLAVPVMRPCGYISFSASGDSFFESGHGAR